MKNNCFHRQSAIQEAAGESQVNVREDDVTARLVDVADHQDRSCGEGGDGSGMMVRWRSERGETSGKNSSGIRDILALIIPLYVWFVVWTFSNSFDTKEKPCFLFLLHWENVGEGYTGE